MSDSPLNDRAEPADDASAAAAAKVWLTLLDNLADGASTPLLPLPRVVHPAALGSALAELATLALHARRSLLIVVPTDDLLPDIGNALDPALRALCALLPSTPFAGRVVARATLALLKARLARGGEDNAAVLWAAQQQRIDERSDTWRACCDWSAAPDSDTSWPAALATLFPIVVISAGRLAEQSLATIDYVVVVSPATAPEALGRRRLLLQVPGRLGSLVRSDEEALLRAELAVLTQEVGHMELELATVQSEVGDFARRYYAQVGALMTELDALKARRAIRRAAAAPEDRAAQAAAGNAKAKAEQSHQEQTRYDEMERGTAQPFRPSTDLKRLYRKLAQKIHPDRASNEEDRRRRTQWMSEANQAYRAGNEEALHQILADWQRGQPEHEAIPARGSLVTQIERLKRRLAEIEAELRRLFASQLYELFIAARLARRRGRDLLEEMAEDLARQIAGEKATVAQEKK